MCVTFEKGIVAWNCIVFVLLNEKMVEIYSCVLCEFILLEYEGR